MTDDQVNAYLAEKVMGFTPCTNKHCGCGGVGNCPNYTGDIAAAFELLSELNEYSFTVSRLFGWREDVMYQCIIEPPNMGSKDHIIKEDKLPSRAIALAVMEAVKEE